MGSSRDRVNGDFLSLQGAPPVAWKALEGPGSPDLSALVSGGTPWNALEGPLPQRLTGPEGL